MKLIKLIFFWGFSFSLLFAFEVKNYNIPANVFGKANNSQKAKLIENSSISFDFYIISSASIISSKNCKIILDEETYFYNLAYRKAINNFLEFSVDIPYLIREKGFLDPFIRNFHQTFNFPNGLRSEKRDYSIENIVVYKKDTLMKLNSAENGIGDISFGLKTSLFEKDNSFLSLLFNLKIPTGDKKKAFGSGNCDYSLSILYDYCIDDLSFFSNLGINYLNDAYYLKDYQENIVYTAQFIGQYKINNLLTLPIIQFNYNSPYYKEIDNFKEFSFYGTFGGKLTFKNNYELNIGVLEDLKVNSNTDVAFLFTLTKNF